MLLFLVGFMGAGKSGIGQLAAKLAGVAFVDTDKEVEKACGGITVTEIFERHGEEFFRQKERKVLESLRDDAIVATGGGLPTIGDAMAYMNRVGRTVYLKTSPEGLYRRLQHGQARRPKIRDLDAQKLIEYIRRTLPERETFYERASMIIDCDVIPDDSAANYVAEFFADRNPLIISHHL